MSTQDDDQQSQGVVWAVLIGVVLLAVSLAIGMGLYRTSRGAATAPAAATTGAPMAPAPVSGSGGGFSPGVAAAGAGIGAAVADGPSIKVEDGVVKFYFASGSDELARGAAEALGDVVRGVAAGKKAVISGFHDVTGDPARNEELAKQRALRVRDALTALGIGEDKLDLRKPAVTTADGSNAEARRVEVTLE
ncbi:MAG TPA: OmpA family protein [Ottowia sp.]|jgi:outer membrane protein OmpA-like peptidoglycan-associated protein|uniref:OmpA family protein n=1 Tax=Ottowia sp. TaxID=1898956 RepID=UPI001B541D2F|nr:OmpA family protein [Ottowia sp.]MBP7459494.1 OmpA family protein [Ottowia sp.]HRN07833.1 OmpA family protein [Ottowia sp.]